MWTTRNQIEVKCCCLVCWKLGLKGQNYSTQSNLIQSGLKGHSYHFLHPSHLFNINMYDMYCQHYYKRVLIVIMTWFNINMYDMSYQHYYKIVFIVIMTWAGMGLAGTGLVMFKPSTALRQASSEQPDPESSLKAKVVMFSNCIRNALIFTYHLAFYRFSSKGYSHIFPLT